MAQAFKFLLLKFFVLFLESCTDYPFDLQEAANLFELHSLNCNLGSTGLAALLEAAENKFAFSKNWKGSRTRLAPAGSFSNVSPTVCLSGVTSGLLHLGFLCVLVFDCVWSVVERQSTEVRVSISSLPPCQPLVVNLSVVLIFFL